MTPARKREIVRMAEDIQERAMNRAASYQEELVDEAYMQAMRGLPVDEQKLLASELDVTW